MITYFFTGADSYLAAQPDKDKSLGGFVSSSPVPNDIIGALFTDVSFYTVTNNLRETKAIVIKNETGSLVTALTTWFENMAVSPFVELEIAAVALTEDTTCTPSTFSMEKISNVRGTPINATFYKPDTLLGAVNLGNIANTEMLGLWLRMTLKDDIQDTYYSCDALNTSPLTETQDKVVWHFDWT